jgi:hypothetical protein
MTLGNFTLAAEQVQNQRAWHPNKETGCLVYRYIHHQSSGSVTDNKTVPATNWPLYTAPKTASLCLNPTLQVSKTMKTMKSSCKKRYVSIS